MKASVAGAEAWPAALALISSLQRPGLSAPIVGATKMEHLDDAVAGVGLALSEAEVKALESPYVPHAVTALG